MSTNDPLSDGSPDGAAEAARLADAVIARSPITLLVQPFASTEGEAERIVGEFLAAQVSLVILPSDPTVAATFSARFGEANVQTISLGPAASLPNKQFAFGFAPDREAGILGDEVRRRGYKRVVVVSDPQSSAAVFASLVATAIVQVGAEVFPVDGSQTPNTLAGIMRLIEAGTLPSAVIFLTDPSEAGAVVAELRKRSDFQHVPVIGSSAWGMSSAQVGGFAPGWYLTTDGNTLAEFSARFERAFGHRATTEAALAYDLIVLASALPQAFSSSAPYAREILQSAQGFVGVTGRFSFGPSGQVDRLLFPVELTGR